MAKSTTFIDPLKSSLLSPDTKILRPRISFRVKITEIDNHYDLCLINCADGSFMLEGVYFTVSYAPVTGIKYLRIIIKISSLKA